MSTYISLTHEVQVSGKPTARLNEAGARRGDPFTYVDLGGILVTLDDPAHARRIAKAFTDAAGMQEAALAEAAKRGEG